MNKYVNGIIKPLQKMIAVTVSLLILCVILGSAFGPGIINLAKNALYNIAQPIITASSPAPIIVERLQSLNRLETAKQINRHIVEAESKTLPLPSFLVKDKLMMEVQLELIAGVDLALIKQDDVRVDGNTVSIRLPSPQLFSVNIDDEYSKVYSREKGWFVVHPNTDLERQARLKAISDARMAVENTELMKNAKTNAEKSIRGLLLPLGFRNVTLEWTGDKTASTHKARSIEPV